MEPLILMIEPELDERAATSTMARAQRVYEQGARDISRVMREQMGEGTAAAGAGFNELETKARKAYLSMQDASEKVAAAERKHQQAVANGAANAESLGRRVERLRLAEIEAIERATAAYNEYGQAAQQAGQQATGGLRGAVAGIRTAGGEAASGFMEGFAGSAALMRLGTAAGPVGIAIASAAALGIAGGKVLADNILAGMDQLRMRDLFQARLGVDSGTMQKIGDVAGASYAQGFGESVEGNLKTISAGIRSGLIGPRSSDADLAKFTERIDTTSKITGNDPAEISAKSRNLIRNGLVRDYTEVTDILNSEAGKQLDITNDLLDTLEEYATTWHKLGISAVDATGLMKQMYDAGIRNTDVAADSIKELSINVADNSKTTRAAFVAMGFDADDMNRKFAAGGVTTRQALGDVLTALRDIQDPVNKNNIGLALFKTKWEDGATAIQAANLKTAASDMGKITGATDDATKQLNAHADAWGNLGNKISEMWDKTQRKLADGWLGNFVGTTVPDWLSDFLSWSSRNLENKPPQPKVYGPPMPSNSSRFALPPGATPSLAPNDLSGLLGDPLPPPTTANYTDPSWYGPGVKRPDTPDPGHGPQSMMVTDDAGSKSLPPAPVLPLQYTNTAGLPSGIANAQQSLDERKHDVAEKQARVAQLEQLNAKEDDLTKARNDLTKAQQDQLKAEQSLTDARINATKQANKQMAGLSSDLDQLGASLDKDFGISKGLGGIVENAVKAVGNALAAPFLQALGFVAKANPNEGSGLVGIMAANGAFGQQYTPGAIAASQATSGGAYSSAGYASARGGGAYPGDAALLSMVPAGRYTQEERGDLTQGLADCSSAVEDLVNIMDGRPTTGASMFTGNAAEWLTARGFMPGMGGPGDFRVGFNGGHMQATLPGGTPFNWGSGSAAARRGIGGTGADDPAFTQHFYRPAGGMVTGADQATTSLNTLASAANAATQALGGGGGGGSSIPSGGAVPVLTPSVAAPMAPSVSGLPFSWPAGGPAAAGVDIPGGGVIPGGGAPLYPGVGMPNALPGVAPLGQVGPAGSPFASAAQPSVGGGVAYPSQGGNSGSLLGGLPLDGIMAATSALDAFAPGSSAAAKIGIQVANRSIGYAAQNAGIAANAVGEFFSVGDNPKGSIGAGWLGKLAGGFAGAAPALPNLAGGKKPPGPMDQQGGGQQSGDTNQINNQINVQAREGASGQEHGEQVAAETSRMWAPAGRQ